MDGTGETGRNLPEAAPGSLDLDALAVPMIAHYDLFHDKVTRTTSALLLLWDGQQLIDATAGFKDNEALVTELLGFRPTRHTPLGADATLYIPALAADPADPEDDED